MLKPNWIFINIVREKRYYQQHENMKQNVPSKETFLFFKATSFVIERSHLYNKLQSL